MLQAMKSPPAPPPLRLANIRTTRQQWDGLQALLAWAFPARCVFCEEPGAPAGICTGCLHDLPGRDLPRCPVCGIDMAQSDVCASCLQRPPAYDHARSACTYAYPVDAAIQRLKYGADLRLAAPLAELLAQHVRLEPRPDVIAPMPASQRRLRERGFNHAAELARNLAALLGLPLALDLAQRATDTPPQAGLPLADRARNVRGAFRCDVDLSGLRIGVVDDVLTSGASLSELARTLRRSGADTVVGWVVARTPLPR